MRATGAEIITRLIERQGVRYIVGIPGGANLPLCDGIMEFPSASVNGKRHARHHRISVRDGYV